jgi:VWFA-related protein
MRPLVVLFLMGGLFGSASADDKHPEFGGAVDVVAVDVTVVDGTGRPVTDMRLDEFIVKVDGRPRRVLSADFIDMQVTKGSAASVPVSVGASPSAAPAVPVRIPRNVVVVVDRGELSAGRMHAAIEAAGAFVDRLSPADRVAVFTLPRGPRLDFTNDRRAAKDVLGRIGPAPDVLMAESMSVHQRFEAYVQSTTDRLDALEALLVALRSLEGAKTLALVTGGLTAIEPPRERSFGEGNCNDPGSLPCTFGRPDDRVVERLRRIATAGAAARATFYALYVSDRGQVDPSRRLPNVVSPTEEKAAMVESLIGISGGALFEVVASAEPAFERLGREISAQYVLSLEPVEGDRDGKPHAIDVRVGRPHVEVRARRQFVITPSVSRVATAAASLPPVALEDLVRPQDRADTLRAHAQVKEGERLLAEEAFDPAAHAFESAIALDPGIVKAHYGLGKARMGLKEYAAAASAFEASRKAFRDYAARQRRKRYQNRPGAEVVEHAARGDKPLDPLPPGLTLALGSAYFRMGRLADAEREYRATIETEPKVAEARVNLAVVLLMTGRPADAREQLEAAKRIGYTVPAGLEKDVVAALARQAPGS